MRGPTYPFSAVVGQEQMKLALLLAAVDWRLGVLLRGDKGAGKTTAARALAALLPEPAPFVNLPIGVTEDRLLGGLHLESTLKGDPVLKPGLLSQAHGGVLYIDEVNLLPGHLGDALLDAASSGVNVVEREGFSASHPAEFALLGSMNPEEGILRPQLLDRFSLSVEIAAPLESESRQLIVRRRIDFERNSFAFSSKWLDEEQALKDKVIKARDCLGSIRCSAGVLDQISAAICSAGVRSLRADLAAVRASVACAALAGDSNVEPHHVEAVLPLVLVHRAKKGGMPPPANGSERSPNAPAEKETASGQAERIFPAKAMAAPAIRVDLEEDRRRGDSQRAFSGSLGPVIGVHRTESPREPDLRAAVTHALIETGSPQPRLTDLHEKIRRPKESTRFVIVIDSSGSHAEQQKMRLVKGATLGLLTRSFRKEDEVVVIAFRGTTAQVLLEPSKLIEDVVTALEYLPTGGRTPLSHALESAKTYLTPESVLILLTDGRANVALGRGDPWQEALQIAGELRCHSLVVDTGTSIHLPQRTSELASALKAPLVTLGDLEGMEELTFRRQRGDSPAREGDEAISGMT
jgi:magnesium chelatase subunit D